MRKLVTGVNRRGRSCITEESDITPAPVAGADGVQTANLWATEQSPPPRRPEQTGHFIDTRLAPGLLRWIVVEHAPHEAHTETTVSRMHHSDTLDLIVILEGSTKLLLADDERDLGPGDCVVMTGVDHAFETGPEGCRMISVAAGTPPFA
jgi:mannose-6-phosphate isomerase-like protein (cupin superfamily)